MKCPGCEKEHDVLLICGDRNWTNREIIRFTLTSFKAAEINVIVLTGGARGADTIAKEEAKAMGFHTATVQAEWYKHGKAAGPIRNEAMVQLHPHVVIAFHDDLLHHSKGTLDMAKRAVKEGYITINITSNGEFFTVARKGDELVLLSMSKLRTVGSKK